MSIELLHVVSRNIGLFNRGLLTAHEFGIDLVIRLTQHELAVEELKTITESLPNDLIILVRDEIAKWAESDYYRRSFGMGDTRTNKEVHQDAENNKPKVRELCLTLEPIVLEEIEKRGIAG